MIDFLPITRQTSQYSSTRSELHFSTINPHTWLNLSVVSTLTSAAWLAICKWKRNPFLAKMVYFLSWSTYKSQRWKEAQFTLYKFLLPSFVLHKLSKPMLPGAWPPTQKKPKHNDLQSSSQKSYPPTYWIASHFLKDLYGSKETTRENYDCWTQKKTKKNE